VRGRVVIFLLFAGVPRRLAFAARDCGMPRQRGGLVLRLAA